MISPSYQKGLSLVELLIAMVLGLLLTAGALQMMLSSQQIYKTTDTLSRIQENGRFSLDFLTKYLRMAGYNSTEENFEGNVFWDGACGGFNPCTANGAGSDSDRIGIIMDPTNDRDCLGNGISDTDKVIVNVFYIDESNTQPGVNSLYCGGYDPATNDWLPNIAPQPLVDGVENMQILYGVVDPVANNAITSYVSSDDVTNWAEVGAVRVALLVNNGQVDGNGSNETRTFNLLDAPAISATDKHNRQVFSTTTVINNIIYQSEASNR